MFTIQNLKSGDFHDGQDILTIFIGLIAIIAIVVSFIAIIISNINNLIKQTSIAKEAEHLINFSLKQMDKLPDDVTHRINKAVRSMVMA